MWHQCLRALSAITPVEAKLHDESRLIQRCFDDNKDDHKGDDKNLKGQRMSSRCSRQNQEHFKIKKES